jgi:N-acetylmuramic acid 6-phosphate etherase
MFRAQEGAEDSPEGAARDVDARQIGPNDAVIGIAAGGTTPYVHGALRRARERGAKTIFISCVQPTPHEAEVDVVIRPITGPEVVTGSTRLKAGTATKVVLNTITTVSMVQLGKVYENLMVDLKASNIKLQDRAARIVATVTRVPRAEAFEWVERAGGHVKVAIVMQQRRLGREQAVALLERHGGGLRAALESA